MPKILNENKKSVDNSDAYDPIDDMLMVKSTQKKFRDSFSTPTLNLDKWKLIQTGAGQTVTQSAGAMAITTGITINAETIIESVETFTIPFRAMFGTFLSQRIANQEFYFELVSVNPDTLVADGISSVAWKMDGVTATSAKYQVQSGGLARLESGASTILTTASYSTKEIECFSDETWFHDRAMDSATGRSQSYVRHQQIPDPNSIFKLRVRVKNGAVAPATTTTLNLQYVTVIDYAELTTEITASRGAASAGMAMPVILAGGATSVSGTVSANLLANNVIGASSVVNLGAGATYTAVVADGGVALAYNSYRVAIAHTAGLTPAHLVFEQSLDNVTFRETHRIPIPSDGMYRTFEFPWHMRYVRAKVINGAVAETLSFFSSTYARIDGSFDTDKSIGFLVSATPLAISGTLTGSVLNLGGNHSLNKHRILAFADQAGTVYLDESRDGTIWRETDSRPIVANTALEFESLIVSQFQRVRFVNGAVAQTTFELQSSLVRT